MCIIVVTITIAIDEIRFAPHSLPQILQKFFVRDNLVVATGISAARPRRRGGGGGKLAHAPLAIQFVAIPLSVSYEIFGVEGTLAVLRTGVYRRPSSPMVEADAVPVGEEQELIEGGDGRKGHRRGFALLFGFGIAFVFFFDFFRDHVDVDVEVRDGQEAQIETAYGGIVEVESEIAREGGVVVVGAAMVADAGVQRRRRGQEGGIQGDVADAAQIGQVAGVGSTTTSSRSSSPSRGQAMVKIARGDEHAAAAAPATTSPRRDMDLAEGQIRDAVAAAAGAAVLLLAANVVVVEFGSQLGEQERRAFG